MADCFAFDERLGNAFHFDGRLQTGLEAFFFERSLKGQSVDDGGQHPHVVALYSIHALSRALHAPEDVAPADDQAYLDAFPGDALDVLGVLCEALGIYSVILFAHQGFSAKFEQDSTVFHGAMW